MTPIEKAETALNSRIDRIQANLLEANTETARQFLLQSLVVCVGIGEALTGYVKMIGQFAQERHSTLKAAHTALSDQHADMLKAGQELLERLKLNPTDRAISKEIELAQKNMASIQKILRRGADALQREVAPSMAMIDRLATSLRRFGEADQIEAIKRATKLIIGDACELYRTQPTLPAKNLIEAEAWEGSALSEIDQATDFYEALACGGYQAMLALDVMTMALSPTPPQSAEEATLRANASVAARIKEITSRLAKG